TLLISFTNGESFFPGDQVNIRFQRGGATERYHIVFTETMDSQSGVDYIVSHIPNSSRVSAFSMQILGVSSATYSASVTKADNYYRELQLNAGNNFKPYDVIDFQFVSRGSSGDIKMPSGKGFLSFDIWSKPNSVMRIAEVFFRVPKNNDVYDIGIQNGKNSKESYVMGISSGWSGNQVSSYGDRKSTRLNSSH